MHRGSPADVLSALLQRLLARHGGRQIFVFGSEGHPFWSAFPVTASDLKKLDIALRRLEQLEQTHPKPFFEYDRDENLLVAALDEAEDLYFVVLESLFPEAAAARVRLFRDDLAPHATRFREELGRRALNG